MTDFEAYKEHIQHMHKRNGKIFPFGNRGYYIGEAESFDL